MLLGTCLSSTDGWPRHRVERASKPSFSARAVADWSLVAAGEAPLPEGSMQDGAAAEPHRRQRGRESAARLAAHAPRARRRRALRPRRHRQAAVAAGDEPGGAERSDSLGSRTVHPVRPQPKCSSTIRWSATAATRQEPRSTCCSSPPSATASTIAPAIIAQAGREPVVLDIEAFALANAYQMNYPERTDAAGGAHPRRPAHHDRLPARAWRAGVHPRHLDRRPGARRRAAARVRIAAASTSSAPSGFFTASSRPT